MVTELFSKCSFRNRLYSVFKSIPHLLHIVKNLSTTTISEVAFQHIARIPVIGLESIDFMVSSNKIHLDVDYMEVALRCADVILKENYLWGVMSSEEHVTWLCSSANAIYNLICFFLRRTQTTPIPSSSEDGLEEVDSPFMTRCCRQLANLVSWIGKYQSNMSVMSRSLFEMIKGVVVSLSRCPVVNSYVLVPPSVWKHGWKVKLTGTYKTVVPPLAVDFLQDVDVLREFIFR